MRILLAVCLISLVGCGADGEDPKAWEVGDEPAADAAEQEAPANPGECVQNSDCGEDAYCHRPSTCGEPNYCVDGYEPVSAAPPIAVCSCDGTTRWANHGYPGPHAWELGDLDYDLDGGAPCDPAAEAPFDFTISVTIDGDVAERENVLVKLNESLDAEQQVVELIDGKAQFRASGDEWVSFHVDLLVNGDDDPDCSESSDTSYSAYPTSVEVDFVTFEVDVIAQQQSVATACGAW